MLAALSGQANAALIDNSTAIPDANVLLNFNNSGLDWVYAGPLAPEEWDSESIHPASYRAGEGWRAATADEWASHPIWSDFIIPGNSVTPGFWDDHSTYLFASEYWSNFSHVDINDFANGIVTDGVNGLGFSVPETIYVRNSRQAVTEPAVLALFGLGLVGLGLIRRRR